MLFPSLSSFSFSFFFSFLFFFFLFISTWATQMDRVVGARPLLYKLPCLILFWSNWKKPGLASLPPSQLVYQRARHWGMEPTSIVRVEGGISHICTGGLELGTPVTGNSEAKVRPSSNGHGFRAARRRWSGATVPAWPCSEEVRASWGSFGSRRCQWWGSETLVEILDF